MNYIEREDRTALPSIDWMPIEFLLTLLSLIEREVGTAPTSPIWLIGGFLLTPFPHLLYKYTYKNLISKIKYVKIC